MNLNDVCIGKKKARKRIGRGPGSGWGKTSGKGHKGQKSRSGASIHPLFEGGQMPLYRRIPKRGFTNGAFKKVYTPINLSRLTCFADGDTVNLETLREKGLISGKNVIVKILGTGDVAGKLTVDVDAISKSAAEKIIAQGGSVIGYEAK